MADPRASCHLLMCPLLHRGWLHKNTHRGKAQLLMIRCTEMYCHVFIYCGKRSNTEMDMLYFKMCCVGVSRLSADCLAQTTVESSV